MGRFKYIFFFTVQFYTNQREVQKKCKKILCKSEFSHELAPSNHTLTQTEKPVCPLFVPLLLPECDPVPASNIVAQFCLILNFL